MNYQLTLIIALFAMVLLLSLILLLRIKKEKRQNAAIMKMDLRDFAEFLKSNSIEGSIVEVARKVSELLINSFGCERIVFIRKKRGQLELNYYHGIRAFNRNDFRLPFNPRLVSILNEDFFPRHIEIIRDELTEKYYQNLKHHGVDIFFPIFWRENLYGVYFIKSNIEIKSSSFNLLIGSMAQSLSAAYHIKWHESKYNALQKSVDEKNNIPNSPRDNQRPYGNILKLVRHRNSETIVPKLLDTFKTMTGIKGMAYYYFPADNEAGPIIIQNGISCQLNKPSQEIWKDIIRQTQKKEMLGLQEIKANNTGTADWVKELKHQGLNYVAALSMAPKKEGLIAWDNSTDIAEFSRQLNFMKRHASDIVENAESFNRIEALSYTDNLTGLSNQRYFIKRLTEEINRAKRYNRKLALIIFDVDELKYTNDTYGHLAGDALLSKIGEILKKSIRAIDIVARYGGDEFCVIMPEADLNTCIKFMERLQSKVFHSKFTVDGVEEAINCTVSIGGAIFPDHAQEAKKLIFNADMALLKAKETGRNKYLVYTENC